jgi:DEAD/DEAH box helicase domain-containing protein
MNDRASGLDETLSRLARRSASSVVARGRAASPGLNAALLRRLSVRPGAPGSLVAEPVFESAKAWLPAEQPMGALAGELLHPDLVAALDAAGHLGIGRDRRSYAHQLEAWQTTLGQGRSCLVTAGTGAGKTECFLVPVIDDLLRHPRRGGGVRAILVYPLNALIESQRERLAAWVEGLGGRVRFALFNGDTPETARRAGERSTPTELKCRKDIREKPPEILVTNITMLEYLLLRPADASILEKSAGALRWIVLDEAHTYAGAQAAEMALLLRRVRTAFGVAPDDVRLVATSATIGGEPDAPGKLRDFVAALAGHAPSAVEVIAGRAAEPQLPAAGEDTLIEPAGLRELGGAALWQRLAPHPRVQKLCRAMSEGSVALAEAARELFGSPDRRADAQTVLDAAARAVGPDHPLLPWRAHLFHRSLGGVWACIDPACPARDPELVSKDAGWGFGAIHVGSRERCVCAAPAFEIVLCDSCGTPHLSARQVAGAGPRLEAVPAGEGDDFALDAEPEDGEAAEAESGQIWLTPARDASAPWITLEDARIWDNAPLAGRASVRLGIVDHAEARGCCDGASDAMLRPLRYGPAFFMGNGLPLVLEDLAPPTAGQDRPMRGRRALSFSDSRQGVARLAAKLQQDAERTLTRSFLYHSVQEQGAAAANQNEIERISHELARLRTQPDMFGDMIRAREAELAGLTGVVARPVAWPELRRRFAQQAELRDFAGAVWRPRLIGGELADDPEKLAEMFLFRELFRRPKVQNNPETMGLLRLAFPSLEERARFQRPPGPLTEAGVDAEGWTGLALAAIDFVFRSYLAVDLPDARLVRIISPRFGTHRSVTSPGTDAVEIGSDRSRPFPGPIPGTRPGPLQRIIYPLIGGHWSNGNDRDRAADVLDALWRLITATVARDTGRGQWRIDFEKAAVVRLDRAFVCPVTRRPFGFAIAGCSPYSFDPDLPLAQTEPMRQADFPRLPRANAGGLTPEDAAEAARWCETDPQVAALRLAGLWSDLHDRAAVYAPFLRAQEHSAQIERPVLSTYVDDFKDGRINLLNCSTTMEMGVDIPDVRLVVNANVPPAISNYRQRAGRAGRRGEPWAFALTFARDLPLDVWAADSPGRYLAHPIVAPRVWFESAPLVQRHVNAALLAAFLRHRGGQPVKGSIGAFFGAGDSIEAAVLPDAPADAFLAFLDSEPDVAAALRTLTEGTVLGRQAPAALTALARTDFEQLLRRWREEHRELLDRAAAMGDPEAESALRLRAQRMRGEFLIGELARRRFTPAYGFPTDVVSLDYLSGRQGQPQPARALGELHGIASRTLDVALREYAPGAELVIDGLVYRSEGVRPAWGADADGSRLEDLRDLWSCRGCGAFGLARLAPEACPRCGADAPDRRRALVPAGFVSRRAAHTGYEALAHVPFEMPRISADSSWIALPEAARARLRADPEGQSIVTGRGAHGGGYAVCLACGRAEPHGETDPLVEAPIPDAMRRHRPLMLSRGTPLTRDGYCPGGYTMPHRVQRQVTLVHASQTDVFELQLAEGVTAAAALALAASLRDALAERLGVEAREIGVATAPSRGPAGESRVSALLFDRAAGGAGYVTRLAELDTFAAVTDRAAGRLACPDACAHGCPACILRPDLNLRDLRLDREGGRIAGDNISKALTLPHVAQVFGPGTSLLGRPLAEWIATEQRAGRFDALDLFLHGSPAEWDMAGWPMSRLLPRLSDAGVRTRVLLPASLPASPTLDLATRIALIRLAGSATLASVPALPVAMGAPVLARIERPGGSLAFAGASTESRPGPEWGAGALEPILTGPAPEMPTLSLVDPAALLGGLGGAQLLWLGEALDGPLKGFGHRFWQLVKREAPAANAALGHGVASVDYTDRYLLTPLSLALLRELIGAMPGARGATISIALAPADRSERRPNAMHSAFDDDALRRDVVVALFPNARIALADRKAELPHFRRLKVSLADGHGVSILLDQGLGGWRTTSFVRHDFGRPPAVQAREIAATQARIAAETPRGYPATIERSGGSSQYQTRP